MKATQARLSSANVEGPYSSLLYVAACKYSTAGWDKESFSCLEQFRPEEFNLELTRLLLEYGADPNESFGGQSTWREFILEGDRVRDVTLETVTTFLDHGAEPSMAVQKNTVLSNMSRADYLAASKMGKRLSREWQQKELQKQWLSDNRSTMRKMVSRTYLRKSWRQSGTE